MVEASLLAAFFGGLLSLLSPCSALLLPAFFAYAFEGGGELVKRTGVFYLGLATTLVPLGMGISAVSGLFYGHRQTLILISGILLITFGVFQIVGLGFSIGPAERLRGRIRVESAVSVYALGAVYGFAGFCSGPILGAVLTVAAASGEALRGAALLAVYAAGMAAPLFLMALLWDRFDLGHRRWLRGKVVSFPGLRTHTTSLLSGLMFVVLGVLFIVYDGTSALEGFYEESGMGRLALNADRWSDRVSENVPVWMVFAVAAVVAVLWASRRWLRSGEGSAAKSEAPTESRRKA